MTYLSAERKRVLQQIAWLIENHFYGDAAFKLRYDTCWSDLPGGSTYWRRAYTALLLKAEEKLYNRSYLSI